MEPFGAAASAIAVIGLSVKVAKAITSATGATQDRRRLREEVRALESTLQQLSDEADDSEESEAWRQTLEALEAPGAPLGRLELMLQGLFAKLQPDNPAGKGKAIASSLKWPFKEKQVTEMLATIEREKGILQIALENNNRRLLQEIKTAATSNAKQMALVMDVLGTNAAQTTARIEDLQDGQANLATEKQRQQTLDWLSKIDYAVQQSDFLRRREPGTGEWLLESPEYEKWASGDKGTLFCPGIPGAGKTILVSVVVENVLDLAKKRPRTGVAYVYCNFNRQHEQEAEDLLGSVARQLAARCNPLPPQLNDLFKAHGERGSPSLKVLSEAIVGAVSALNAVFVIIDALDECQPTSRTRFMSQISQIQTEHNMNIFVTSRFIPQIMDQFKDSPIIEIKAHEADVRLYLDSQMSDLPSFVQQSPQLWEDIRSSIINVTDGMFLLAQLHIRSLVGKRSPKAVKTALTKLPQGSDAYDFAYNDTMQRIEGQPSDQASLAKEALMWITRATRQITALELQHALAVEVDELDFDEDNMSGVEDILSACAGLVTLVQESNVIRLVHYTTQEYFDRTWAQWFVTAEAQLAATCVAYLSLGTFRDPSQFNQHTPGIDVFRDKRKRDISMAEIREYVLYEYAALNWGYHARGVHEPWPRLLDFLVCPPSTDRAAECFFYELIEPSSPDHYVSPVSFTTLHVLSMHGLFKMGQRIPGCLAEVNTKDGWNRTPLYYAASLGHIGMVRWLLENGADPNERDIYGQSACFSAARHGHSSVLKVLMAIESVKLDVATSAGNTPLSIAAQKGHLDVVVLLIDTGKVDIDSKNETGQTPLLFACIHGHADIVRALLDTGRADLNYSPYLPEYSPLVEATARRHLGVVQVLLAHESLTNHSLALWHAAESGNKALTKLLLDTGKTDVNVRGKWGATALTANIMRWVNLEVVDILLAEDDIEPDIKDANGISSLSWAADMPYPYLDTSAKIVQSLLSTGKVDVNSRDDQGRTPLLRAIMSQNTDVVNLLLSAEGIEPDVVSHQGWSPLQALCEALPRGESTDDTFAAMATALLACGGVDVNRQGNGGWTPLTRALYLKKSKLAHALLTSPDIDIDKPEASKVHGGRTPLSYATGGEDPVSVIQKLLDKGVNVNARDERGRSPLSWAASRTATSSSVELETLIEAGAEVDGKDNKGRTPLSYSVQRGHFVRPLVANGADVNSRDKRGKTPLICVGRRSRPEAIRDLISLGADVQAKDQTGMTALMAAARIELQNGPEIVKVLLEAGAKANEQDTDGRTAMYYICGHRCEPTFEFRMESARVLLSYDADVSLEDNDGQTILEFAQKTGAHWMVSLLERHVAGLPEPDTQYPRESRGDEASEE